MRRVYGHCCVFPSAHVNAIECTHLIGMCVCVGVFVCLCVCSCMSEWMWNDGRVRRTYAFDGDSYPSKSVSLLFRAGMRFIFQ